MNNNLEIKSKGAFLGAAIGDALGWPQEIAWKTKIDEKSVESTFKNWIRKGGSKYFNYEETINEGEYSDDTQLLLATARSLLQSDKWWKILSEIELPFWTAYERGGGGATKRAAGIWLEGKLPWRDKNKLLYFEAGGNGVAMRILPHLLFHLKDKKFDKVAHEISLNGILTHGHPRAIVGALAYGYALWIVLHEKGTLKYGSLIDKVLESKEWTTLPEFSEFKDWIVEAESANGRYKEVWTDTIQEVRDILNTCRKFMKQGALSVDRQALSEIGCFDKKINGSGTVSAGAAIFLASRYAVDPMHGLLEAAFASGADTDTIASMTGGLLGAIDGVDWINSLRIKTQDSSYIENIASHLATHSRPSSMELFDNWESKEIRKNDIDSLFNKIFKQEKFVILPDRRSATVSNHPINTTSKTMQIQSWKLTTQDGQSIFLNKIYKKREDIKEKISTENYSKKNKVDPKNELDNILDFKVITFAQDLNKMKDFYKNVIGLKLLIETPTKLTFDQFCIHKIQKEKKYHNGIICFRVRSLEIQYNKLLKVTKIIKQSEANVDRKYFVCADPENNLIEFYQDDTKS